MQRICRSARNINDLSSLLESQLDKNGPTEYNLYVLDEIAERTKDKPIDGNELYKKSLDWIDRPDPQQTISSHLIERLLKVSPSFVLNVDTFSIFMSKIFDLKQRNILWTQLKDLPLMKIEGTNEVLLNYAIKAISNWISVPSQKRDDNLDLFEFVNHIFSFVD